MNNKGIAPLLIGFIIFGILAIAGGSVYYVSTGGEIPQLFQQESFSGGCNFIQNPTNPNALETEIVSTSYYKCDPTYTGVKTECIVQGFIKLDVGQTVGSKTDCPWSGNGYCCKEGSVTTCRNRPWGIDTTTTIYSGYFNFIPNNIQSFPNAPNGIKNLVNGSQGQWKYTDEYKLQRGQSVQFAATYGNGEPIPNDINKKMIKVRIADCSCNDKVAAGTACDINIVKDVYCSPQKTNCPQGYNYYTQSAYCSGQSDSGLQWDYRTNVCRTSATSQVCKNPINSLNNYKVCTSTKDASGCYTWSNSISTAQGTQLCYVGSQIGVAGKGVLKCPSDQCGKGSVRVVNDSSGRTYQQCGTDSVTQCNNWGSTQYCDNGFVTNPLGTSLDNICMCAPVNGETGSMTCISNNPPTVKIIDTKYILKNGVQVQCPFENIKSLPLGSEKICKDGGFTCDGVDSCTRGEIKCLTKNSYQKCDYIDGNENSCLKLRNATSTIPGEVCENDVLVEDPNIGCATSSLPEAQCDTSSGFICGKDVGLLSNNASYNRCICDYKKYTIASGEDSSLERCNGLQPQFIEVIGNGTSSGLSCSQWVNKGSACDVNNEVCRVIGGEASCKSKFENVAIVIPNEQGVNLPLEPLYLNVTGNIDLNLPYRILLYENTSSGLKEITTGRPSGSMSSGITNLIDLQYTPTKVQQLVIEVTLCQDKTKPAVNCPEDLKIVERKDIEIKKSFELKLFCPVNNYINEKTTCNMEPTDTESNLPITISPPQVYIVQGTTQLTAPVGGNSFSFTPKETGSISVNVIAQAEGYIKSIENLTIFVNTPTSTQTWEIDDKNIEILGEEGIDVGVRKITVSVKEGNGLMKINKIDAYVIEPSGGNKVPLTFNNKNDVWTTTYNFQQAGNKYIIKGQIVPQDTSKDVIPINIDVRTLKSLTEKERGNFNLLIIGVSVASIIIIAAIILFIILKKKKKR